MTESEAEIVERVRRFWGTKTLEDFRLESEKHPEGGVFEAMRGSNGRRMVILLCATRPDDISALEKIFTLIDDGTGEDWRTITLLDLLMGSSKDAGFSFACTRDKDGRRNALVFLAHTPRSISRLEQVFGLSP